MSETKAVRSRFARSRKPEREPLSLTERDEALLVDLFIHQAMSRGQLQELYFGSVARCNLRLRKLFDHGYLSRDFDENSPYGAQGIYRVGPKATTIITRKLDIDAEQVKKVCQGSKRPEFLEHTLEIVDFYLATQRALASESSVSLESWMPELQVRHEYDVLTPKGEKKQIFKPDGFMRIQDHGKHYAFFLEVDRGNASGKNFTQKVAHYQDYLQSGIFHEMYGDLAFQVLVVTTGMRRLLHLKEIVELAGSPLFAFTTRKDVVGGGLLNPIWYTLSTDTAVRILPGS